jgi:hypothetical protein
VSILTAVLACYNREKLTEQRRHILAEGKELLGIDIVRTAGEGVQAENVEAFVKADLHGTAHTSTEMRQQVSHFEFFSAAELLQVVAHILHDR